MDIRKDDAFDPDHTALSIVRPPRRFCEKDAVTAQRASANSAIIVSVPRTGKARDSEGPFREIVIAPAPAPIARVFGSRRS